MRKVIVNSTPLIVLGNAGLLEILQKLYGRILVPEAVYQEVTAKDDAAGMILLNGADWIQVEQVQNQSDARIFSSRLHAGEVEVMLLAREQKADLLIIDDNAAKSTAKYLGMKVTGSLGVLLRAKQMGFLEDINDAMERIIRNGFYVSEALKKHIIELSENT